MLARWQGFEGAAPVPDPALDVAFAALQGSWGEPAAHEAFLSLARQAGALDGAAARYRQVLRHRPDDLAAQRALQKLAALAVHQQANAPRQGLAGASAVYYAALVIAVIMLSVIGVVVWTVVTAHRG